MPERVLGNQELAERLGVTAEWIWQACGIRERRIATESVPEMGAIAARRCLEKTGFKPEQIRMVLISSGSAERRFPGPAVEVGRELGIPGVPCLDTPVASAGALIAIILASKLTETYGPVLVVASEKMSPFVSNDKNTAILFGDGAGVCLVSSVRSQSLEMVDSAWHSDGQFADALQLRNELVMDGLSVIMHAARKIPAAIQEVAQEFPFKAILMHQANQNLLDRVAKAAKAPAFSNIERYGNTSSASLLIAADEYFQTNPLAAGDWVCFSAFGAGFQWGAVAARLAG